MASARMSYGCPKARALASARTLAGQREEGLWLASARRPGQSQDGRGTAHGMGEEGGRLEREYGKVVEGTGDCKINARVRRSPERGGSIVRA